MKFATFINIPTMAISRFNGVCGNTEQSGIESEGSTVIPINVSAIKIVVTNKVSPGAGKSRTYTLRKNGSATALTATISGATETKAVALGLVTFAPGDIASVTASSSGLPAATDTKITFVWDSTNANESFLAGDSIDNSFGEGTYYLPLCGDWGTLVTTQFDAESVSPGSFTLKNLYVMLSGSPGTLRTRTYTVLNSGTTAITLTITGTATSGVDLTHTATMVAGDPFTIRHTSTAFPVDPASSPMRYSLGLVASNPGEFIINNSVRDNISASTEYYTLQGAGPLFSATEINHQCLDPIPLQIRACYAEISSAPGSFGTRNTTLRLSGVDTAVTVSMPDPALSGHWTGNYNTKLLDPLNYSSSQNGGIADTPVIHSSLLARVRVSDPITADDSPRQR